MLSNYGCIAKQLMVEPQINLGTVLLHNQVDTAAYEYFSSIFNGHFSNVDILWISHV